MPKPVVNNKITYQNIYGLVAKYEGFVGQGVKFGDSPTFANLTLTGDATVEGNLYVEGNTTILDTNITEFEDNILLLNRKETGAGVTLNQSGLEIERGSAENYRMVYNDTDSSFKIGLISNMQCVATREDAPLHNGIMIWNNTAKRMDSRTTIDVNMSFSSTRNATSPSSGSVVMSGGLSITKDIWSKGKIYLQGTHVSTANSIWTNSTTNSLNVSSTDDIYLTTNDKIVIPYEKRLCFGDTSQSISANSLTKHIDISGGGAVHFNLLAGAKVTLPNQIPITFATDDEYIYTDSSNNLELSGSQNINLVPGPLKRVLLPAERGLSFGNYNQQIVAALNNDLTIESGNNINLRPGNLLNVRLPTDNGIQLGDNGTQVIVANSASDLSISASRDINLTATRNIVIPGSVPIVFSNTRQTVVESGGNLIVSASEEFIVNPIVTVKDTSDSECGTVGSINTLGGLGVTKTIYGESNIIVDSDNSKSLCIRKNNDSQDVLLVNTLSTGQVSIVAGDGFTSSLSITSVSNTDAQNVTVYKTAFDATGGYAIGRGSTARYSGRTFTFNMPTYNDYLNAGHIPRFMITTNNCSQDLFSVDAAGNIISYSTEQATSVSSASFIIRGGLGIEKDIIGNGSVKTTTDSSEAVKISTTDSHTVFQIDTTTKTISANGSVHVNNTSGTLLELNSSYVVDPVTNLITNDFRTLVTDTTDTTDTSSGAFVVSGGVSIQRQLRVSEQVNFYNQLNMNNTTITNVKDPVNLQDVATKAYVDLASLRGLYIKQSVQAATVTAGNLTTDFNPGDVIDGYTLQDSDRILIKNQTDPTENGIYIVYPVGPPQRSLDLPVGDHSAGVFTFIKYGTLLASTGWISNSPESADIVGTHAITFGQFSGLGQITAGDGLSKTFNEISVNVDDQSLEIVTDALRIKNTALGTGMTGGSGDPLTTTSDQSHVTKLGTIDTGVWEASIVNVNYGGTGRDQFTTGTILFGNGTAGVLVSDDFYYDTTTKRLGLGTDNPQHTFHVCNSVGSTLFIESDNLGVSTNARPEILLGYNANVKATVGVSRSVGNYATDVLADAFVIKSDKIQMVTDTNARLTIIENGNVGIHTSDPTSALDVNGKLTVTGDDSTNTATGAVVVNGGIGITQTVNVGGILNVLDNTPSTSSLDAAVVIAGGLSIQSGENAANVGNGGGLTVLGGGSFSGDLWIGGSINGSGSSSTTFAYLTLTATDQSINLSTGSFLTLGGITTQCLRNATSRSDGGSILTPGGASIGKDVYIGGNLYKYGTTHLFTDQSVLFHVYDILGTRRFTIDRDNSSNDFGLSRYDPIGSRIESTFVVRADTGTVTFENSTTSTSSTNGAIIVMGGLSINNSSNATNVANGGAVTVAGGLSVGKNAFVGGNFTIEATTESNGGISGALQVRGGVSITKDLTVNGAVTINDKCEYASGGLIQSITNSDGSNYMWAYLGEINDLTPASFCELEIVNGINPNSVSPKTLGLQLVISIDSNTIYATHRHYGNAAFNDSNTVRSRIYRDSSNRFHLFVQVPPSMTTTVHVKTKTGGRFFMLSEGNGAQPNGSRSGYLVSWAQVYTTAAESNLDHAFGNVTVEGLRLRVADPFPVIGYNNANTTTTRRLGLTFQKYQRSNDTGTGEVANGTVVVQDTLPNQSAANSSQIRFSNSSSSVNEFYTGWWVRVTSGTNINQIRKIVSYNGAQRVAELDSAWTTQNPTQADTVNLYNSSHVTMYYNNTTGSLEFVQNTFDTNMTITSSDYTDVKAKALRLTDTTVSTNASIGSIHTLGGIAIQNTADASSASRGGTFTTLGGGSISKRLYVGDSVTIGDYISPAATLHLKRSTATAVFQNDQDQYSYINFVRGTTGNCFGIVSDTQFSLTVTGSDATPNNANRVLTVMTSGNIGIQTTTNVANALTLKTNSAVATDVDTGHFQIIGGTTTSNAASIRLYGNSATGSNGNVVVTSTSTGSIRLVCNDSQQMTINNDSVVIFSTRSSSNASTGSLVVYGGVSVSETTNATNVSNGGGLTVAGGLAVAKHTYIGGDTVITGALNATGAITTPVLIFGWEVNCSLSGYEDTKVLTVSDEAILSFSVWLTPDVASENCQFEFELPDRTANFDRRTELCISCSGYTDDTDVIPLSNVIGVGVKDQRRGMIKFQSVSTGLHYFSVLCRYTKK